SLLTVLSQAEGGIDLLEEIRNKCNTDPFLKRIADAPQDFKNFEIEDGLIYIRENGSKLLCIPQIIVQGRSAREIVISEAHSLLAHLGVTKTLAYLRAQVWWK
ncbi:hypothetical protein BDN70DRAFT_766341, partial [Pholiota conissans]